MFGTVGLAVIIGYCSNKTNIIQRQLSGNNNIEKAWNFYQVEGFSEESIAGILGNYMRESGMDPTVEEKGNNIGYGIAQWSFTRRTDLENWSKQNNFLVSSLEGQLNFSMHEMKKMKFGKYNLEEFKKIKDVKLATEIFEQHFERAGVVAMNERISYAQEIYKKYSKKSK
ncbi:phage tail tip lysozyme [Gemella cuniculi]|uniref:phage tail tip lysozyme n=1 Tax=Gemella cuniculi TaxID=150240 RepID=UPI0003F56ADC|nr:phage tail tip lysozyme [Gemella cuniculi]